MSQWGTFEREDVPGEVHVMPCDGLGEVVNGHIASEACWCSPVLVSDPGEGFCFSHNDPERGGYNA